MQLWAILKDNRTDCVTSYFVWALDLTKKHVTSKRLQLNVTSMKLSLRTESNATDLSCKGWRRSHREESTDCGSCGRQCNGWGRCVLPYSAATDHRRDRDVVETSETKLRRTRWGLRLRRPRLTQHSYGHSNMGSVLKWKAGSIGTLVYSDLCPTP